MARTLSAKMRLEGETLSEEGAASVRHNVEAMLSSLYDTHIVTYDTLSDDRSPEVTSQTYEVPKKGAINVLVRYSLSTGDFPDSNDWLDIRISLIGDEQLWNPEAVNTIKSYFRNTFQQYMNKRWAYTSILHRTEKKKSFLQIEDETITSEGTQKSSEVIPSKVEPNNMQKVTS